MPILITKEAEIKDLIMIKDRISTDKENIVDINSQIMETNQEIIETTIQDKIVIEVVKAIVKKDMITTKTRGKIICKEAKLRKDFTPKT